jgi:enoyl-CoA hydratase
MEVRMAEQLVDGVLTIGVGDPEQMNVITGERANQLADLVDAAAANDAVKVVVLKGDSRSFSAGGDLQAADRLANDSAYGALTIDAANRLTAAMVSCPKPIVALVQAGAVGLGVPISLAADLVICDTNAYFMLAFAKIGLMPDGGATALVTASIGRARAMRMALLAERLTAAEAFAAGLVSHLVPANEFEAVSQRVIRTLRDGPQVAYARTKHAINAAALSSLGQAFALERSGQIGLLAAPDFSEGSSAFLEKRKAVFVDRVAHKNGEADVPA